MLIEHELSKNIAASEGNVKIRQITETENELSIHYEISYTENFKDGEKITRTGRGWALMRKDSSGTQWKLYRLRDPSQTLHFNKGTVVGS